MRFCGIVQVNKKGYEEVGKKPMRSNEGQKCIFGTHFGTHLRLVAGKIGPLCHIMSNYSQRKTDARMKPRIDGKEKVMVNLSKSESFSRVPRI